MSLTPPRAKKSLGQNFLRDLNLARKIVQTLRLGPMDQVVEIGPGPGILTGLLLEAAPSSLTLMEKDPYWAEIRRLEAAAQEAARVKVMEGDALEQDWSAYTFPCKIVGNLPYNIASPLMWEVLSRASGLERAVFMVQKEVGLRITAAPSSRAYGALSVWIRNFCRPCLEFTVPPHVFIPRPKVWSAVLSFDPMPLAERPQNPEKLAHLLKIFFQQRRKQMGVIWRKNGYETAVLECCGINPAARPEEIAPEVYKKLADIF
ncbi:MAG: 16S rRNA (adenine(1518)-N(6)/adenine(1519)-N(6))-dimethyltransferase RsmA [Deltaproteobacteria bacterium]|jgi:16S rRNA (adenine1518-N6/adenine1519-N6)-dimethyltransferase|nr:16S rRNA (adenine(1518)-N(6)/adenine(1519)-N(6))-dimethyltransferase RsmA [Deltaproteobacteria bacterium]